MTGSPRATLMPPSAFVGCRSPYPSMTKRITFRSCMFAQSRARERRTDHEIALVEGGAVDDALVSMGLCETMRDFIMNHASRLLAVVGSIGI